jgi:molybdopterin synthase sulfur carrier subunit
VAMATVLVLYFAGLRDAVGCAEESVELRPSVQTVNDLCDQLAERHAPYAEARAHVRVAHNEVFASGSESLGDGDVVALIPPVAGG